MTCDVCKQELGESNWVQWFGSVQPVDGRGPFNGRHHLRCPEKLKAGSPEQRAAALKAANVIRLGRAKLKRDIAACLITVEGALEHPAAGGMAVYDLLRAQPHWGPTRAERFLRPLLISPYKHVDSLTVRQREMVVVALNEMRLGLYEAVR